MIGNKLVTSAKGRIVPLCQNCRLYDPMYYQHGKKMRSKYYIRGSKKMNVTFYSQKKIEIYT